MATACIRPRIFSSRIGRLPSIRLIFRKERSAVGGWTEHFSHIVVVETWIRSASI
jgi:hypothetical protein